MANVQHNKKVSAQYFLPAVLSTLFIAAISPWVDVLHSNWAANLAFILGAVAIILTGLGINRLDMKEDEPLDN